MPQDHIYFDNASTTILFDNLISEFYRLEKTIFANSSSIHSFGKLALSEIENSRRIVADILKTSPDNIYFLSGATEANNTILIGAVARLGIKTIITSPLEHPSVLEPLLHLSKAQAINLEYLNNSDTGELDYAHLQQLLSKYSNEKCLVSIMHGNNEIGNLNDIHMIADICKFNKALFHSDIVQTAGYYDIFPEQLGLDFLSISAHKFHGPKNVGIMYLNNKYNIEPLIKGGKQEMGMRAGTQSAATISLASLALQEIYQNKDQYNKQISKVYNYCITQLTSEISNISINGSKNNSLNKILNISIAGNQTTESLLINLDLHNIYASSGSACMSGAMAESHVLKAINYNPNNANIRISFGINNSIEEVDYFIQILKNIYNEV